MLFKAIAAAVVALAVPTVASAITTTLIVSKPYSATTAATDFCPACDGGPGRIFTEFVLQRAVTIEVASFAISPGFDPATTFTVGIFAGDGDAVGAAIVDTVFAPDDVISQSLTGYQTTVVRVPFPLDLAAGRYFFSFGADDVIVPAYLKSGGLVRAVDGNDDRRFDNIVASFTLDGTLAAVPEPRVWALLIAGYGLVGFALRRRGLVRHVSV